MKQLHAEANRKPNSVSPGAVSRQNAFELTGTDGWIRGAGRRFSWITLLVKWTPDLVNQLRRERQRRLWTMGTRRDGATRTKSLSRTISTAS